MFLLTGFFAIVPVSMAQAPGDVYLWEFNEGSGGTVSDANNQFTANLGIIVQEGDIPQSVSDSPSGAVGDRSVRPGAGLVADDSENPVLDIQDGPITLEAWIKVEELNAANGILAYGSSYKLGINNGFLVFTFYGIEDVVSAVGMDANNVWQHVAAVWEPGIGVTFFHNGQSAGLIPTANSGRGLLNNLLNIGSETNGSAPLIGLVDRARIHNAVLSADQLDSVASAPKEPLAETVIAYDFNETGLPYQNQTDVERPAESMAHVRAQTTAASFSELSPRGTPDDYSLCFDGNDRVTFLDEFDIMQFDFEDFTFEAWVLFDPAEQIVERPVLLAYGVGGQNGYSFSIRAFSAPQPSTDSPSGQAGDFSVRPNALVVDDSNNPILDIGEGPITIETWYKSDGINQYNDFVSYGDSYKVGINDGHFVFTFRTIEDVLSDAVAPVDGQWHHVAYAWEPGVGVTFYLDGQQVDFKETSNTNRELQTNLLNIGSGHNGGSIFPGLIDRVRVHNALLTAGQLDSNAGTVSAPLPNTVVAYPFDEGALPFQSATSTSRPATALREGSTITVTTFGLLDAHSNATIPDDGQWHHIAAVHEDSLEFRFYVDGELKETMPYTEGVRFALVNEFLIGSEASGGNPYVGYLDRLKITRAALNEGDLDYFEPAPVETPVEHWSLY